MFDNRLANLRKERGLNKKEMAKALNLPYTTYLNYENNEREPNSETLIRISNFLNVSIDYLLGVSNIKLDDVNIEQAQEKNVDIKETLAKQIGLISECSQKVDSDNLLDLTRALLETVSKYIEISDD